MAFSLAFEKMVLQFRELLYYFYLRILKNVLK